MVAPFPDRDSISQFYFPFLNYLRASLEIGNDFWYLRNLVPVEYPCGILLIPALISMLGMQEIFLGFPWLVTVFLLLPLSAIACLVPFPEKRRFLFILAIFFFPITQIAFKNFNIHSFNVLYSLSGALLYCSYKESGRRDVLFAALFCLWFSCAIKHLGIIFFLCAWISILLWLVHSRRSFKAELLGGVLILAASLPFYPIKGFSSYTAGILRHNPALDLTLIGLLSILSVLALGFTGFVLAGKRSNRRELPKFFASGWVLLILGSFLTWVISLDSGFEPLIWMCVSSVGGFALLCGFLNRYDLSTPRALLVLFFLVTLSITLVLYFSRLAQVSMIFFPCLYIALILVFKEATGLLVPLLFTVCFSILSNGLPDLRNLEKGFGSYGFGLYARGYNLLHQNLLGWSESPLPALRRQIRTILEDHEYPQKQDFLLALHPHLHSHSALALQFPDQLLYRFPPTILLEQLPDEELRRLYHRFRNSGNGVFQFLLEEGVIGLILFSDQSWSKYVKLEAGLAEVPTNYERRGFCTWLQRAFWKYLLENSLLDQHYRAFPLNHDGKIALVLYLQRGIPTRRNETTGNTQRLTALRTQYRESTFPHLRLAKALFQKASRYFDSDSFLNAYVLLKIAAQLDPEDIEIRKDLEIAYDSLRVEEETLLRRDGFSKVAAKIHPGLQNAIGWRGSFKELDEQLVEYLSAPVVESEKAEHGQNPEFRSRPIKSEQTAEELFEQSSRIFDLDPSRAREILRRVLDLNPHHQEAKLDLQILEKQLENSQGASSSQTSSHAEMAQKLFLKSTEYFDKDPQKAIQILAEALRFDSTHRNASEDLRILQQQFKKSLEPGESITSVAKAPQALEWRRQEAQSLFEKATRVFDTDPIQARKILQQVLDFDPDHKEARKDLLILKQRLLDYTPTQGYEIETQSP